MAGAAVIPDDGPSVPPPRTPPAVDALQHDYRAAFLGYLSRRDEAARLAAYELGRAALTGGLGLLDIARVHHEVLLRVLREHAGDDPAEVGQAASEFLLEVLAAHDMVQRVLLERPPAADAS